MNDASPHPPFDRLADLAEGRLARDAQAAVRAHLTVCARCAGDAAWLERTIGLMRADAAENEDAPAHVVARAARLLRPPATDAAASRWRRVLATLQFDSGQMPLAPAMRATAPGTRQLLYGAAGCDLDLRIAPAGDRWVVSGQALGPEGGGEVELRDAAGTSRAASALSDLGEFALPPVPPGGYTLRLRVADVEVEIADLSLGA